MYNQKCLERWMLWLSWLERCPVEQEASRACTEGNQLMFVSHINVSLSLPLKAIKKISSGENEKEKKCLETIYVLHSFRTLIVIDFKNYKWY